MAARGSSCLPFVYVLAVQSGRPSIPRVFWIWICMPGFLLPGWSFGCMFVTDNRERQFFSVETRHLQSYQDLQDRSTLFKVKLPLPFRDMKQARTKVNWGLNWSDFVVCQILFSSFGVKQGITTKELSTECCYIYLYEAHG